MSCFLLKNFSFPTHVKNDFCVFTLLSCDTACQNMLYCLTGGVLFSQCINILANNAIENACGFTDLGDTAPLLCRGIGSLPSDFSAST